MECPIQRRENADLLLAYCARRLDPETAAVLERHMQVCPACRAFGESQQAVWSALDLWEATPVSEDFDRRLYDRLGREERAGFWSRVRPWFPVGFRPVLPVAVASAIVTVAFLVQSPSSAPSPAQLETVDAEQVERVLDDLDMLRQLNVAPRSADAPTQAM
jgi:anti-sigma factor RsiW